MSPGKAGNSKLPASRATSGSPLFCRSGTNGVRRVARICSRDHRGAGAGLCREGLVTIFSPVGLDEDVVDLLEVDDAGLIADGFDE